MILDISVTVYPLRGGITVKFSKNAQKNSCRFRMYDQLPSFKTFPSAEFKSNRKLAKMSFAQMRGENGPKTRRVTLSLSLHPPAAFSSLPERQRVRSTLRSYSFFWFAKPLPQLQQRFSRNSRFRNCVHSPGRTV